MQSVIFMQILYIETAVPVRNSLSRLFSLRLEQCKRSVKEGRAQMEKCKAGQSLKSSSSLSYKGESRKRGDRKEQRVNEALNHTGKRMSRASRWRMCWGGWGERFHNILNGARASDLSCLEEDCVADVPHSAQDHSQGDTYGAGHRPHHLASCSYLPSLYIPSFIL